MRHPAATAQEREPNCNCQHLACVCGYLRDHKADCKFLIAASSAVAIECDHGRDCCPTCDPCTCAPSRFELLSSV